MSEIKVLMFGGCNLRGPLIRSHSRNYSRSIAEWKEVPGNVACAGPPFITYTLGEMLQTLEVYHGDRYIPTELRAFCGIRRAFAPDPDSSRFALDGIIAEPNTSTEIEFEGYYLNRAPVLRMLHPLKRRSRELGKLAGSWYKLGIVGMNADLTRSIGDQIIRALPADYPSRYLVAALLRNARGRRRDIRGGLERVVKATDVPIGVVAYTWQFLPDGRPISWPAGFYQDVLTAARDPELPAYEPRALVEEHGVPKALKTDRRHYREEFMPRVAKSLVEFVHLVVSGRRQSRESLAEVPEFDATAARVALPGVSPALQSGALAGKLH